MAKDKVEEGQQAENTGGDPSAMAGEGGLGAALDAAIGQGAGGDAPPPGPAAPAPADVALDQATTQAQASTTPPPAESGDDQPADLTVADEAETPEEDADTDDATDVG